MTARLITVLWLLVVWVALWEDVSAANVASGVVVGLLLTTFFPVRKASAVSTFRPLKAVQLLAYFLWKLLEANVVVAWEVITPSNANVNEAIVAVPLTGASDVVVATVANMISLTPGTLTLEIERHPTVLYVHVLHLRTIERVRVDVLNLELRVLRALDTETAIALAERRLADVEDALRTEAS
ncbi:MAG TPA: Na+/H+ antiporter subunit E [Acidimicrobiales bacterium]|nr:Na+/H+ antiporter subunit E [Acidimicrobiales bacterium]